MCPDIAVALGRRGASLGRVSAGTLFLSQSISRIGSVELWDPLGLPMSFQKEKCAEGRQTREKHARETTVEVERG